MELNGFLDIQVDTERISPMKSPETNNEIHGKCYN